MHQECNHDAQQGAHQHFQPGMTQEFHQFFGRKFVVAIKFFGNLVEKSRLDAGGSPHTLCINHDQSEQPSRHRKHRGAKPRTQPHRCGTGRGRRCVGTRHAPQTEKKAVIKFVYRHEEVNQLDQ